MIHLQMHVSAQDVISRPRRKVSLRRHKHLQTHRDAPSPFPPFNVPRTLLPCFRQPIYTPQTSPTVEHTPPKTQKIHQTQRKPPCLASLCYEQQSHPSPSTSSSCRISDSVFVLGKINLFRFGCAAVINQNERKIS